MSTLTYREKSKLENLFSMRSGYVLDFTDRTFEEFFMEVADVEIHSDRYRIEGTSKAYKMRAFWKIEPDFLVGKVLLELIGICKGAPNPGYEELIRECAGIANRLLAGGLDLRGIKETAEKMDARSLRQEIVRMEDSVESDPELAIGTAKELVESCCKTILLEKGTPLQGNPSISELTKATLKALKLVPEDIPDGTKGADVIRRTMNNLSSIISGINELRNLYGTGHGREAHGYRVSARHAKLVVGAAATIARFLLDTWEEQKQV